MSLQEYELLDIVRKAKKYKDTNYSAKQDGEKAFQLLLVIFDPEVKKVANRYYISGSDPHDVMQECRLGLMKAVDDFNEDGGMSFKNFAFSLCIKRHVITAIAHANRKKYDHHNNSVSLDTQYQREMMMQSSH